MITNKYLHQISSDCIDRAIKAVHWRDKIPSSHWDDIKQEILIHVFSKKHLYNKKWHPYVWVKRVVSNQLKNRIRDGWTCSRKTGERIFDGNTHQSIYTKVVQRNVWGGEEVVYEPDMVAIETRDSSHEFAQTLSESDHRLLETMMECGTMVETGKRLRRPYQTVYRNVQNLKKQYRQFLDT